MDATAVFQDCYDFLLNLESVTSEYYYLSLIWHTGVSVACERIWGAAAVPLCYCMRFLER